MKSFLLSTEFICADSLIFAFEIDTCTPGNRILTDFKSLPKKSSCLYTVRESRVRLAGNDSISSAGTSNAFNIAFGSSDNVHVVRMNSHNRTTDIYYKYSPDKDINCHYMSRVNYRRLNLSCSMKMKQIKGDILECCSNDHKPYASCCF